MPPRNVANVLRRRGIEVTAKDVQNIHDAKGYSAALVARELVTPFEENLDKQGWYMNVVKDETGKLAYVFWISVEQLAIARRFPSDPSRQYLSK